MCIYSSFINLMLQKWHISNDKASIWEVFSQNACILNIKLTFH